MPLVKPGRVTRRDIVLGSWQSMQDTGWASPMWCAKASRVVGAEALAAPVAFAGVGVVRLDPPGSGWASLGVPSGVLSSSAWASVYDIVLIFLKPSITAGHSKFAASCSVLP